MKQYRNQTLMKLLSLLSKSYKKWFLKKLQKATMEFPLWSNVFKNSTSNPLKIINFQKMMIN